MTRTILVLLAGAAWAAPGAATAEEVAGFGPERWTFRAEAARPEQKLGRSSLFLQRGFAFLKDVSFADGTLEVDVALPPQRTFAGVVFRVVSEGNLEEVYLRPHKSGLDDALQYQPRFDGSSTWQIYSAPDNMAPLDIPKERWCRLKVVYSGLEARVYFDGAEKPVMVIPELKRGWARGGVGLWAGPAGTWFSSVRWAAAPEAPPPPRPQASLHPGVVRSWELSAAMDAEEALPEALPPVPEWQRVPVEPPGILVIDRYRKSTGSLPPSMDYSRRLEKAKGRRVVYARALVESDREQVKRLAFGYSDEVCVFLNGRILFRGRSPFRFRDPTFMGVMDVEDDAVYLPLAKGPNELVMAVAEYFGGWGLAARFDDPSGLRLP